VSILERPSRERPRPARPRLRPRIVRAVVALVLLALAFLLGIAFARTLDERPRSGDVVTSVRTLEPLPQTPPTRTVTVTVTQR
jgi:hypothetical protein